MQYKISQSNQNLLDSGVLTTLWPVVLSIGFNSVKISNIFGGSCPGALFISGRIFGLRFRKFSVSKGKPFSTDAGENYLQSKKPSRNGAELV